ncbi:unnamed protein product [Rotaria sordida]|uniref:Uncharacterized protein n=1 Tax=Rotaria sordida TaxID=392033 RepID=A0A813P147_9BILA|nr:unnamed protein product [Rotaria sordida]CAF0821147.1 unnamed protein product [Rotaria sordida]CAF1138741.1 unnamed protein product [Rotaria sordida]
MNFNKKISASEFCFNILIFHYEILKIMEKTNISIENEEQVLEESGKVVDHVTDDVLKKIEEIHGEIQTIENQSINENVETNDDEVVPSTTPKPIEEQENVIDTNINVSACVSPGRSTTPFKEVNESEKETCTTIVNRTENKRELDNEDEQTEEKFVVNNERTGDQTKKLKINDTMGEPIVETNESEVNMIVNDTIAVEV